MTLSKGILILGASFWGDNMREMVILGDTVVFVLILRLFKFLQCGKFDI